jgi:hypothetical protein
MVITNEHIHDLNFNREVFESVAIEHYYTWEVDNFGFASSNTKWLRHYWLSKLLTRQLREFDRG